jgi:hypothetical protein
MSKDKKTKHSGRQPREDRSTVYVTIAARLSPRVVALLKEQAEAKGIKLSKHIRNLCRRAVKKKA